MTHTFRAALTAAIFLFVFAFSAHADAAENGRIHTRLDSGWRFLRGELPGEANAPGGTSITNWAWQQGGDAPPSAVSPDWKSVAVGTDVFHGRHGFAWFQTTLPGSPNLAHRLHFESVDDNATVYLNGVQVVHHSGWDDPFDADLSRAWKNGGPNILLARVENTDGAGGIMGEVTIPEPGQAATPKPALPDFADDAWRVVHLPHDYVVEGVFTPTADASHGSLPTTTAWYRKTFFVPAFAKGKRISVEFDGIYRDSRVWLNGHYLGNHKSGYTGFRYDITSLLNYGGTNTLAVHADARRQEGWWYEGGGIYRHVWLNQTEPLHVAPYGVYVTSKLSPSYQSAAMPYQRAALTVQTTLTNDAATPAQAKLVSQAVDENNKVVGEAVTSVALAPGQTLDTSQTIPVSHPRLWSLETPHLYRLRTSVSQDKGAGDALTTEFGIREFKFDANTGFSLNGKPVKIQGTCNHQDFAGVGIAMPDSLLSWRIATLKTMGSNGYRMSHNPPAAELLDACDRQGMLVMDENRHLGDTYSAKTARGTTYSDLSDLKELILRDRNHPSVILWSLCNEEGLQGSEEGKQIFAAMMAVVHQYDKSRPISCAMNGGWGSGISDVEDLQGINYAPGVYDGYHQSHPSIPMYGSETASTVSTRGEYVNDATKGYVSAYDVNAPPWAQTAEVAWKPLAEKPFMAGGFVWTGFDYKGEPTPYGWPCINSHFGIMDECGFPKDNYYYYQAWWGSKPLVHILPHWNWTGKEGKPIDVWVYSSCDTVELFLNGKSLGTQPMPRYGHLAWSVPYAPGTLTAKGYTKQSLTASDTVETTGAPVALRLTPDRATLTADGEDTVLAKVEVIDAKGRVVPEADTEITFAVTGAARLNGTGNGDASSHEPDKGSDRRAFHGLGLAVVQATEAPGLVRVTATAPGLRSASVTLQARTETGK